MDNRNSRSSSSSSSINSNSRVRGDEYQYYYYTTSSISIVGANHDDTIDVVVAISVRGTSIMLIAGHNILLLLVPVVS